MTGIPASHRLATYGTLLPGGINESQLSDLSGSWVQGAVRGRLMASGWGAEHGCPGMIADPGGEVIQVQVFTSADLPDHWSRLDAFEGVEYQRVLIPVETDEGVIEAYIYELSAKSFQKNLE